MVTDMKSDILTLLSRGAKSEVELAAFFGFDAVGEVMNTIEELESWGIVESRSRQVHEGNNVFRWDREYSLCNQNIVAA